MSDGARTVLGSQQPPLRKQGWVLHRSRFRYARAASRGRLAVRPRIFELDEIRLLTTHLNCHTVLCQLTYGVPD